MYRAKFKFEHFHIFFPPLDRGNEFKVLHGHPIDFVSLLKKQVVVQFPLFERYDFSLEKMTIHPFKISLIPLLRFLTSSPRKHALLPPKSKDFPLVFAHFSRVLTPKCENIVAMKSFLISSLNQSFFPPFNGSDHVKILENSGIFTE